MTTKRLSQIALLLALGIIPIFAQTCTCGQQDCVAWTMSCATCGFTACDTSGAKATDPLDLCQANVPLKCAIHLDQNGNKVICANQNKIPQCYQRDLKASGIKCSNNALATYTTTGCCSN
jgi:hypothetical protein